MTRFFLLHHLKPNRNGGGLHADVLRLTVLIRRHNDAIANLHFLKYYSYTNYKFALHTSPYDQQCLADGATQAIWHDNHLHKSPTPRFRFAVWTSREQIYSKLTAKPRQVYGK